MIPVVKPEGWVTSHLWRCFLSLMSTHMSMHNVDVISEVDTAPMAGHGQWAFYMWNKFQVPLRVHYVDGVLIARALKNVTLQSRYNRLVVITEDINSTRPLWVQFRFQNTVVLKSNGSHVNAYTWFPYRPESCHRPITLDLIDTCSTDGQWSRDLYPDKVPRSFGGCPVYYKTTISEPDVMKAPNGTFYGREVTFMTILARSLDLTVVFRPMSRDHYFPILQGHTAVNTITKGDVDIAFASMALLKEYAEFGDPLPTYHENPLVWMIPRAWPKKRTSGIYSGFPPAMWMGVVGVLGVLGLVAVAISHVEGHTWHWLDLVALLVASPTSFSSSSFLRTFLLVSQFYCLHIVWFYQSVLLANLCKIPMEKQMIHPREAVARGFPVALHGYMKINYFNHSEHEMWNQILADGGNIEINATSVEQVIEERTAIMLGLLEHDGVKIRRKYRRNLSSMFYIRRYLENPVVAYGSRGSPLTQRLGDQMLHLIQSGLLWHFTHLEKGYLDLPPSKEGKTPQVLQLEPLQGAFVLHALFLGLAMTVFIAELFTKKQRDKIISWGKKQPQRPQRMRIQILNFSKNIVTRDSNRRMRKPLGKVLGKVSVP